MFHPALEESHPALEGSRPALEGSRPGPGGSATRATLTGGNGIGYVDPQLVEAISIFPVYDAIVFLCPLHLTQVGDGAGIVGGLHRAHNIGRPDGSDYQDNSDHQKEFDQRKSALIESHSYSNSLTDPAITPRGG